MDADHINKKIEITWAAVDIYQEKGRVSIPDLVQTTKLSATEIYELFPNKKAILAYFYPALVMQYWAMIEEIEDFENYSISEKFSNFIYTMFDLMAEREHFVKDTFDKLVFRKGSSSDFHEETTTLFKEFLTTDGNIAVSAGFFMGDTYYKILASQYLFLIKYWLNDPSDNKERTLALSDKLASLFEEIVYNKSLDKGFDLIKFIFGGKDFESWLPKLDDWNCSSSKKKKKDNTETNIEIESEDE
ncbi:MAG: TetR family transcriptional regulator C-terminal domain-containing protein [bacterium]|nr:TetR family transcriptional regulator C-terminal domain-containing protein [bacterium]